MHHLQQTHSEESHTPPPLPPLHRIPLCVLQSKCRRVKSHVLREETTRISRLVQGAANSQLGPHLSAFTNLPLRSFAKRLAQDFARRDLGDGVDENHSACQPLVPCDAGGKP